MQSKVERLIHATIALTDNYGLVGASTAKIAKRAKVATGTLFHHFPSKDQLIAASYLTVQKDYAWNVVGIFDYPKHHLDKRLIKYCKVSIDYWSRHAASLSFTLQVYGSQFYTPALKLEVEQLHQHFLSALAVGIKNKMLSSIDPSISYQLIFNTIIQTAHLILNEESETKRKRIRKMGVNFLWNAIRKR